MRVVASLLAAICIAAASASAQDATTTTVPPVQVDEGLGFATPRTTLRGFLAAADAGDWERAARHLDLRGRPSAAGPTLARQFDMVLRRTMVVEPDALADTPEGDEADGLRTGRDLVGTIASRDGVARVFVERVVADDGTPEWKLARTTVQRVPALAEEFGDPPLAAWFPGWFADVRVLGMPLWQWLALVAVAVAAWVVAWIVFAIGVRVATPIAVRTRARLMAALLDLLPGPARLGLAVFLASGAVMALRLPVGAGRFVGGLLTAGAIVAVTWLVLRLVDALSRAAELRLAEQATAGSLVPLARRSIKVVVIALAALAAVQNLGFNVTGVIAGLGVGGLAVALAAQKTLENLFGGLSIIADAPVRIGDYCRFGDRTGTVEDIGLRSVRLRTPERTVITVPNGVFASAQIENFGARDRMLFTAKLLLRPDADAAALRAATDALHALLRADPHVDPDPARVRLVGVAPNGLELEVFAYLRTDDLEEFFDLRQELLLAMLERLGPLRAGGSA